MLAQAMLARTFSGSTQLTVGRVRFSPVRVIAGTGYLSNNLSWVLRKNVGGWGQFPFGCVRFGPARLNRPPPIPVQEMLRKRFRGSAQFIV